MRQTIISVLAGGRFGDTDTALVFPTNIDSGPANRYDAGTFQFTAAVPEPSAYLMALLAAGMLGGLASQRKKR